MNINDDFSQRVLVRGDSIPWIASPTPGVDRRMLDRIGGEVARATSIVRYAPNSEFPPHTHGGGEEFIVLDGVFQDEYGDYPAGTYVRNPPTTRHKPGSAMGCTIFVKLWQFDLADRVSVAVDIHNAEMLADTERPSIAAATLFEDDRELVRVERWSPNMSVQRPLPGGAELLVLEGACADRGDAMRPLSWLRLPLGAELDAVAGVEGALVWIKTGGLRFIDPPLDNGAPL